MVEYRWVFGHVVFFARSGSDTEQPFGKGVTIMGGKKAQRVTQLIIASRESHERGRQFANGARPIFSGGVAHV